MKLSTFKMSCVLVFACDLLWQVSSHDLCLYFSVAQSWYELNAFCRLPLYSENH